MMDGIAIRYSMWELGKRNYPITATQAAGAPPVELADSNTCIEVMTGGVLPDGCDCIIPVEEIKISSEGAIKTATIRPDYAPELNQHIHRVGSDTPQGEILVPKGALLNAPELTIAASCGITELRVSKLPRIALISTGDELVAPEESPAPYQIRRSHATALRAVISAKKLGIVTEKHVADDPEKLKTALQQALAENDILILTGGVSRGKFDYVAPVLADLLGEADFHGVAQRPGKPLAFWGVSEHSSADDSSDVEGKECKHSIFALPGNPCSVMACAARYLFPALTHILSGNLPVADTLPATGQFNCPPTFTGLISCRLENGTLHLLPPSNSGNFLALAGTHGVAELPGKLTRTDISNHPASFYPWS
jgi:molybdopterin molybdotransferase